MAMTNQQVAAAFKRGEKASTTNLVSDGVSLWSYGWWEVARWVGTKIVIRNGSSYSVTTATKHRPQVYGGVVAKNETPSHQSSMNL